MRTLRGYDRAATSVNDPLPGVFRIVDVGQILAGGFKRTAVRIERLNRGRETAEETGHIGRREREEGRKVGRGSIARYSLLINHQPATRREEAAEPVATETRPSGA